MKYIKQNKIYTIQEIRQENPNMSIPADADCSSLGFEFLEEVEAPVQDGFYAVEGAPVNNKQTWELIEIPKEVPQSITPRQLRMQLTREGLRSQVESIIQASTDYDLKDWYEYSTDFRRDNPILLAFANSLGLTSDNLDDMFIKASKL